MFSKCHNYIFDHLGALQTKRVKNIKKRKWAATISTRMQHHDSHTHTRKPDIDMSPFLYNFYPCVSSSTFPHWRAILNATSHVHKWCRLMNTPFWGRKAWGWHNPKTTKWRGCKINGIKKMWKQRTVFLLRNDV